MTFARVRAGFAGATLLAGVAAASCDSPPPPARTAATLAEEPTDAPVDDLPPSASNYATDPTANPATGGAVSFAVEEQLRDTLRARGDHAVGDGRLAQLARWSLRQRFRKMALDPTTLDAMTRRIGLVSPTPQLLFFLQHGGTGPPIPEKDLKDQLGQLPTNIPLTRYGIATIGRGAGTYICVVLEALEVQLQPVPKRFGRNDKFHLSATLSERFTKAHLSVTLPDGSVRSWESSTRGIQGDWTIVTRGVHRVELLGDGPSGPIVTANFPIYVEVDETEVERRGAVEPTPDAGLLDASSVEGSMLGLLNEARAAAKLNPVQPDDALAATARAHSADMQAHGFFGHVSPATGTPEDRLRAAHLLYSFVGENLARSSSAEQAHKSLMESPGHRGVMLTPEFTHVGIGAVVIVVPGRGPDVFVTMEFARERHITDEDVPRLVLEATDMARLPHFIPKLRSDRSLDRAAQSAVAMLLSDPTAGQRALEAAKAQATGGRTPARSTCVALIKSADLTHMAPPPATMDPRAESLGVAGLRDPDGPEAYQIVVVVQGRPKEGLACQ